MKTNTVVRKEPIVEKLTGIVAGLENGIAALSAQHTPEINRLRENHQKEEQALKASRLKEIAEALNADTSEMGKAMKDILFQIHQKGRFETYEPFAVKGLWGLSKAKLVEVHVDPTSLYADVDTYETDPTCYVLTSAGAEVCSLLKVNETLRKSS